MRDTRYQWADIFGAVCPERGVGAGLVLPRANTAAMNLHLAGTVAPGAHALVILDGTGWHRGGRSRGAAEHHSPEAPDRAPHHP